MGGTKAEEAGREEGAEGPAGPGERPRADFQATDQQEPVGGSQEALA